MSVRAEVSTRLTWFLGAWWFCSIPAPEIVFQKPGSPGPMLLVLFASCMRICCASAAWEMPRESQRDLSSGLGEFGILHVCNMMLLESLQVKEGECWLQNSLEGQTDRHVPS